MKLRDELAARVKGDVTDAPDILKAHSHDTSIFERTPKVVVFPKSVEDVAEVVRYARAEAERGRDISVTARAAGTDMSGGPLNDSIILSFTKYMNHLLALGPEYATVEPGLYYRDFEKETLSRTGRLLPSYPASRELAALGGMIANNSGGELTLQYGKTEQYVEELEVVLSDGSVTTFKPLTAEELADKKKLDTFEGEIYRKMHALIEKNRAVIDGARPKVPKNSAGYALWSVEDREKGTFNLAKLIVGSQGTLALFTKARLKLVKLKPHRAMMVMFLTDLHLLPKIVHEVLHHEPESFESYDDHTFRLAVRFLPQIIKQLGFVQMLKLGLAFIPELWMVTTGGVPKLVLMAEFADDTEEKAKDRARAALHAIRTLPVRARLTHGDMDSKKYWIIRRESFALLRKNLSGYYASPFIDDMVVPPDSFPEFIPELNALMAKYDLIYTIAGHVGSGNFHIIPLMNLADPKARETIMELTPMVYELVSKYHGSTTGEHNDGIIRTPYLHTMFKPEMIALFEETKRIFDPFDIFNPGKKVSLPGKGGTEEDIRTFIRHESALA